MKIKYVKQENIMDCGVACLLSIIRYYGGDNTIDNIRYLTNCDKNGISAFDLVEASKKLGFDCKGIKCNISYLENIKLPVIVHTFINKAYKHYVIVHKIDKNKIIVFDPAIGIKKYSYDEFSSIFSNVVITLYPIRKLDVVKQKLNYKVYFNLIKEYKFKYTIIFIVSLLSVAISLLSTFYFKMLISDNNISIIYIVFLVILFFRLIVDYLKNNIIIKLYNKIDKEITITVHNKLISLPNNYFDSRHAGDLINKINNTKYIVDLFCKVPIILLVDLSLVICTFIILFTISRYLFLIFLMFVFLYFVIFMIFNNKNKRNIKNIQDSNGEVISNIEQSIDGINTIKNMSLENYINDKFKYKYSNRVDIEKKFNNSINIQDTLKNLFLFSGINTVLYLGIILVNRNLLLFSNLILFNSLIFYFIEPLKNIFELEEIIKNGIISIKSTSDFFCIKEDDGNYKGIINNINVVDLSFNYSNKIVFNNFNLKINNKDKIVITGSSGIGKSTLVKMFIKNIKVDNIYFNNISINEWNRKCILSNICYLSEKEKIFCDTVYNNITLGEDISKKKINKALKYTYIKKILWNKKMDINSLIFENGSNFSLGELQRIVLARCLLRNSNILILDESLNGIDRETERKILKNILKVYKEKIVIYITHRKDNIDLFNRNINLNKKKGEKI